MNTRTPFYLLSAARSHLPAELNEDRTLFMRARLAGEGVRTMEVDGCYKGTRELAVLIPAVQQEMPMENILDLVKRNARLYEQETYLYVDTNGYSTLHDADGALVASLGRWHEVDESEAIRLDAYTKTPDGRYWSAA